MMHVGVHVYNWCTVYRCTHHTPPVTPLTSYVAHPLKTPHNYIQSSLPLPSPHFCPIIFLKILSLTIIVLALSRQATNSYSVFRFEFSEDLALSVSGYQHETIQLYRIIDFKLYISKRRKSRV